MAISPFFIRRFCHVINELLNRLHALWRVPARTGELLLALTSCYSLWRVDLFSILMLSASTRPALALACWHCSPWRVPRALASLPFSRVMLTASTRPALALCSPWHQ
ncbi:hypothetical protein P8452_56712 [Trifolium repens]|nr:hypothetical protein P8452_56712 [Trifolium repens]